MTDSANSTLLNAQARSRQLAMCVATIDRSIARAVADVAAFSKGLSEFKRIERCARLQKLDMKEARGESFTMRELNEHAKLEAEHRDYPFERHVFIESFGASISTSNPWAFEGGHHGAA